MLYFDLKHLIMGLLLIFLKAYYGLYYQVSNNRSWSIINFWVIIHPDCPLFEPDRFKYFGSCLNEVKFLSPDHRHLTVVTFVLNELWWPRAQNILSVTWWMLWPLVTTNYGSIWPQISSLWPLIYCGLHPQWIVVVASAKGISIAKILKQNTS